MAQKGETLRLQVVQEFYVEECCKCGVPFAMTTATRDFYQKHNSATRERTTENFYCPNGHSQHYLARSEEQRLRQQLAEERERNENRERFLAQQRDREQASHRATKGHLTRQRKRAANGVCPCCKRTFKQLSQHMKRKHPEFVEANS